MKKDAFDEREQSEEAKFKQDEEIRFKVAARRNKLLGLWVAERMSLSAGEAETYAKEVVASGLKAPGLDDVADKVSGDLAARGVRLDGDEVQKAIKRFQVEASTQIAAEYPEALAPDHIGTAG